MQRAAALALGLLALGAAPSSAGSAVLDQAALVAANPIRKVVNLLQHMQQKVEEEGKREKELYQKFECYCSQNQGALGSSIGAAKTAIPSLESDIKSAQEEKAQLEADLKKAQVDRDAAKQAIAEATALREKQAATFAKDKAEYDANTAAIAKAVAALEKGTAGSFLQTRAAKLLQQLVFTQQDMQDSDRQELAAFLAGGRYAPKSGQIIGILKQLGDTSAKTLAELIAAEEAAIKSFQELLAAKKKEVEALTNSIQQKMERAGELGVSIVQMQNDLAATQKSLSKDEEFLANLESSCSTKADEMKEREQTRSQELAALADTIKLLNDDDALDLFKKTLPGPGASFVQLRASGVAVRARALQMLRGAKAAGTSGLLLDRVVMALHGEKVGFDKVVQMIDGMVQLLKKEQQDDEHKKEYCAGQFDFAEDKQKSLELSISDSDKLIADTEESIAKLAQEIAALEAGLQQLDKSVTDATEQRRREHEEYQELLASDNAAKELLEMAKNRLNKFYSPKLYKEEAKKELSAQDRILSNMGAAALVQVSAHTFGKDAPQPAPETFQGTYEKKSQESTGVIAMIDLLIKDLDKELQEAGVEEKNAQRDYERLTQDAAAKRAQDSKLLTEKEATKATLEGNLQTHKDAKESAAGELKGTELYIQSLHAECDWLLQYFDTRKEAREGEVESLEKAKAVLAGASYSFVQAGTRSGFLSRTA